MILDEIVAWKRLEVEARKAETPRRHLEKRITRWARRPFAERLRCPAGLALLAEIKRASPSAGTIRETVDVPLLAASMEKAGAHALSVLTDAKYFRGSLADMTAARKAASIPVLQKDFVIDPYQVYEAAAEGADAVLLILRILSDAELAALMGEAGSLSLDCLFEAHCENDLGRALDAGARLVGINNRDLATLKVDIGTTLSLMRRVPSGITIVSQSGISTPAQAKLLYEAGVSAIQVGESLMRSGDPGAAIRQLLSLIP